MILIHNPRCSKSRAAKAMLEEKGLDFETRLYLEDKLSKKEITDILKKLDIPAEKLLRKGEDSYRELASKKDDLTEEDILELMVADPKVIERPILINGDAARTGRPPENILEII
jgi:arsenate reductase